MANPTRAQLERTIQAALNKGSAVTGAIHHLDGTVELRFGSAPEQPKLSDWD